MKKITAVITDDDKSTVDVFSEYLEIKEINIIGKGHNGKDAIKLYAKLRPDIIFVDIMMNKFDGFYALEKIKEMDINAKVVIVTADFTNDTSLKLAKLNPSSVIYKPFDINLVMQTIHDLTGTIIGDLTH